MYVSLPLGPFTLPTAPLLAIIAALLCLEVAARAGRRFGMRPDDVWNTGLIAIVAGLIVARLWNVFQFADIYRNDPLLIISPRPSGFPLMPGLIAALIAAYANLIRKALDPLRVAAAYAVGLAAAAVIANLSDFLTGATVGNPSLGPLAVRHYFEMVQPTALVRMALMLVVALLGWFSLQKSRPARTLWIVLLGYGLMLLLTAPYVRDPALLGAFRRDQIVGLALALLSAVALALEARGALQTTPPPLPNPIPQAESASPAPLSNDAD